MLPFTSSLDLDHRILRYDVRGSLAHARMLGRTRIILPAEAEAIVRGLEAIGRDFEQGRFQLDDPVTKFIPEWKGLKVRTGGTDEAPDLRDPVREITVRDLLMHMSGLQLRPPTPNPDPGAPRCRANNTSKAATMKRRTDT